MFSLRKQQLEICILNSNLQQAENDLMARSIAMPELEVNNEQKYKETMKALKTVRILNVEREKEKQENVRLTAKRLQLQYQTNVIQYDVNSEIARRTELENLLKSVEDEEESEIRSYEDVLREKCDRFRASRVYYDKNKMQDEFSKVVEVNNDLETEMRRYEQITETLMKQLDALQPNVPNNILNIVGKSEIEKHLKAVDEKRKVLTEERNNLDKPHFKMPNLRKY